MFFAVDVWDNDPRFSGCCCRSVVPLMPKDPAHALEEHVDRREIRDEKISIDIDCTPEEARQFLGLPDVAPLQAEVMKDLGDRLKAAMKSMDPESLWKTWMPMAGASFDQMQKAFWAQFDRHQEKAHK